MDLYLVSLIGQGDQDFLLVEKDVWDFILEGTYDDVFIEKYKEKIQSQFGNYETCTVESFLEELVNSGGSTPDNDRALSISYSCCVTGLYDSITALMNDAKEHNIVDEYHGIIY